MLNRKYYSFERNNYYYGKLLTSKDFQSEQGYMNDKRRLGNRILHGQGIVYGLDVVAADDSSIILQSGMALDASGREIVAAKTQVIKLSTIEGYQELKTNVACLGIAYAEEENDPVYAVMGSDADGENKEYNHVKEGFRLFLQDYKDCVAEEKKLDKFLSAKILYQDEDICVTQYLPTFLVPGVIMKGKTELKKCSHQPCIFSFSCKLLAEGFELSSEEIKADNLSLDYGDVFVLEQTFRADDYIFGNGDVAVSFQKIQMQKSGVKEEAADVQMMVSPVFGTVLDYVHQNSYKGNLDIELDKSYDEKLWIANIRLIRSSSHAMIDCIERAPFEQYVCNTEQLMILEKLHQHLTEDVVGMKPLVYSSNVTEVKREVNEVEKRSNSSGVFEMSLSSGGESGKVYFSDEIMHGLGNGPVYVEIGVEYISRDSSAKNDRESIILGDGSIFSSDSSITDDKIFEIDKAVKILPSRGTFIVGIRPKTKLGKIGIRVRWYAFKPEDLEQRVYHQKEQKGCIMIQPDTMVLSPKGSIHINPVFINMPEEALSYTLLDPEGGKIDNTGLYTAPAQEGVYEIKVEALSDPEIFTHAFMIVSQKKMEE